MKVFDCGDCYLFTRLQEWQVQDMLNAEGWTITVKEISWEEYEEVAKKVLS